MKVSTDIKPVSYLKSHAADILKQINETHRPVVITQNDSLGRIVADESRSSISAQVADGLELSLWASDSLAPDPVAMDIDRQGRVYLTRTHRQKNSEFDIRGHVDWMI